MIRNSRYIGMSRRQLYRFFSITKGGGGSNFSFFQKGGRKNIEKHRDQENTAARAYLVPGVDGLIRNDIK